MRKKVIYVLFITIFIMVTISVIKGTMIYYFLTSTNYSHTLKLHQTDKVNGYSLIPDKRGFQYIPTYDLMEIRIDKNGFRSPLDTDRPSYIDNDKRMIFIGDSYTFGQACHVQNTFPDIVDRNTSYSAINAGVGGYSYVHSIIRARELVQTYEPAYVFLQISPWILDRCASGYLPGKRLFKVPSPYFKYDGDNGLVIADPFYQSNIWDFIGSGELSDIKDRKRSIRGYLYFLANIYIPYKLGENYNELGILISRGKKEVFSDLAKIENFVLEESQRICADSNTHLVLLIIGKEFDEEEEFHSRHKEFLTKNAADITVINAENALWDALKSDDPDLFDRKFLHWDKDSTRIVDRHLNTSANKIIAEEILKFID